MSKSACLKLDQIEMSGKHAEATNMRPDNGLHRCLKARVLETGPRCLEGQPMPVSGHVQLATAGCRKDPLELWQIGRLMHAN